MNGISRKEKNTKNVISLIMLQDRAVVIKEARGGKRGD